MKKMILFATVVLLLGFNRQTVTKGAPSIHFFADGKKINVYTTADSTQLRLSLTDSSLSFADFGQPKETQPCVFVDPSKTFQTMVGIGGALTDATAETFAKLAGKQATGAFTGFLFSAKRNWLYTCQNQYQQLRFLQRQLYLCCR